MTNPSHVAFPISMSMFVEDWNASQFWYGDATSAVLARQLLDGATRDTRIAVVSCPSVFVMVKNLTVNTPGFLGIAS